MSAVFLASVAVAVVVLWGLWEGASVRVKTHEAAAFLMAAPVLAAAPCRAVGER